MSLKSLSILIDNVREATEEQDINATTGIRDNEVIRFLNQGQNIIFRKIIKESQKLYSKSVLIPVTPDQKEVEMPPDIYAQNRLMDIKFIYNNIIYQVNSASEKEDLYTTRSIPYKYYRRDNKIVLIPDAGYAGNLQVTYIYKLPELGLKSASIDSVTTLNNEITSLVFNVTSDVVDSIELNKYTRFSVVDREGRVKMANIKFDFINTGSGEVTITPGFTFLPTESIAAGDTVIAGPYNSTHSYLESDVEEYIVEYATLKLLQRQGSSEVGVQAQLLLALEADIMAVYNRIEDDIREIPILDNSNDDSWNF